MLYISKLLFSRDALSESVLMTNAVTEIHGELMTYQLRAGLATPQRAYPNFAVRNLSADVHEHYGQAIGSLSLLTPRIAGESPSGQFDRAFLLNPIDDALAVLCCPITLNLFEDPVLISSGITYERRALEAWQSQPGGDECPLTKEKIVPHVIENKLIKEITDEFCELRAEAGYAPLDRGLPPLQAAEILSDFKRRLRERFDELMLITTGLTLESFALTSDGNTLRGSLLASSGATTLPLCTARSTIGSSADGVSTVGAMTIRLFRHNPAAAPAVSPPQASSTPSESISLDASVDEEGEEVRVSIPDHKK